MRFHELDSLMPDQLDFVPRERRGQVTKLIIAFVITAAFALLASYSPLTSILTPYGALLVALLIGAVGLYVITRHQIALDLLMSSEYQSMLLARGFGVGYGFGMIVRRDGTIVHASDGLESIFPRFNYSQSQVLDGVFEQGMVRKNDRERIMGAIYSGTHERLVFPIITPYQDTKEYIITVEPIDRPIGYSVIRGREYLGKRTGIQIMPDALSLTSVDKLEHLLSNTGIAHFTTDAFGKFEYVNPAFDRALGYNSGEIIESKLSVHHVVFSMGQTLVTEESTLHDYVGDVELLLKDGHRIKGMLQQHILRDTQGKSIGVTGTLAITGV